MPYRSISKDLKAQISCLRLQGYNVRKICTILGVKKSFIYYSLAHYHCYGISCNSHTHQPGHRKVLSRKDLKLIVALLNQRHCIYVNKIKAKLYSICDILLSQTTLLHTLSQLHYFHKIITVQAWKRDNLMHSTFINRVANEVPNPDILIFIDKAVHNRRALGQAKGWSLVGRRCVQRRHFICRQRFSILPILTLDGIITYDIIPGSVDSRCFVQFLCKLVVYSFSLSFCLKLF